MATAKVKNIAIFEQSVYEETFPENSHEDFLRANDIYIVMDKIFGQNPEVESVKFIIMDDEYLQYLQRQKLPNNLDSRKAYMKGLSHKLLDQIWDSYPLKINLSYFFLPVRLNLPRVPIDGISYTQLQTDSLRRLERHIEGEAGVETGSVRIVDTLFSLDDLQKETIVDELEEIAAKAFTEESAATAPDYYEHPVTDDSKVVFGIIILMYNINIPREVTREFYNDYINPATRKITTSLLNKEYFNKHLTKGFGIDSDLLTNKLLNPEEGVTALATTINMMNDTGLI